MTRTMWTGDESVWEQGENNIMSFVAANTLTEVCPGRCRLGKCWLHIVSKEHVYSRRLRQNVDARTQTQENNC